MKYILIFFIFLFSQIFGQNNNIAVLDLEGSGIAKPDLVGLSNRLRTELFQTGKFTVLERSRMDDILKEQGFQASGCTNTECAVEIGKLIGVQKIILGNIDKVGSIYSVNIRMVDVATGKIEKIATKDCEDCTINFVFTNSIKYVSNIIAGLGTDNYEEELQKLIKNDQKLNVNTAAYQKKYISPKLAGFSSLLPIWSGSFNEKFNPAGMSLVIGKCAAILLLTNYSGANSFSGDPGDGLGTYAKVNGEVFRGITEEEYFDKLKKNRTLGNTFGAIALGLTIIDIIVSVKKINKYNENIQITKLFNYNEKLQLSTIKPSDNKDRIGFSITYEL